ncbi:MAG: hypothetical protein CME70_21780 [Halobacteriovorax sp.]|nr:hypothetical protein [Halobacteriovorax sp.]
MKKFFFKLVILVFTIIPCAHAYQFTVDFNNGFYWASLPLGMSKFVTDPNDGPELAQIVGSAENAWEGAVGRDLWSFNSGWIVTDVFSGNYIRWSDNFGAETGYDPDQTLAITIRYNSGTHMTRTEIILNGNMSSLRNNENGLLDKTILHEMGHTLGLDHSFQPAIMGAFASNISTLQWDDVQGANSVIDETLHRQSIGYVSPLATSTTTEEYSTCGSVSFIGSDSNGGGPGGGSFMVSLLMGLMLAISATFTRKRRF